MSGTLKSGLIFAVVGIVGVLGLSFVPFVGALCCGPLVAGSIGTAAGYYGVRWSGTGAGMSQGLLAAALAGVGALIGGAIFWLISFSIIQSNPELYQEAIRQFMAQQQQQQTPTQIDPAQLTAMMGVIGPIIAICFGVLELLITLTLGALGGWLATRNRNQPAAQQPMAPPPMAPSP